jgi:ribosomal-protein-alanine N-acetyltransferase
MRDVSNRILIGQHKIRPLSHSDLDAVLLIEENSFTNPWSEELFLSELGREGISRCFVADVVPCGKERDLPQADTDSDSGKEIRVAGYLMSWMIVDELHITNLAVRPDLRRSGLASSLILHALQTATQEGAAWCQLEVRLSNTAARSLYEKFGFREVGTRRGYYHDGEDAMVLGLDLSGSESWT